MKKQLVILTMLLALLLTGCGPTENPDQVPDQSVLESDIPVPEDDAASLPETESDTNAETAGESESDSLPWPDVIPSDVPKLEKVTIEGHYPLEKDQSEYLVNFSIEKENEQVMLAYISTLTDLGYVEKYKTDNNFGFDYFGSTDKYDIFINVVYGSSSKIDITIK